MTMDDAASATGPDGQLTPRQREIKEAFIAARGDWPGAFDGILQLDPEFFAAYSQFSSVPWRTGSLEPKVKELVYIALDASATHLYPSGTRNHMKRAIAAGATAGEIMEVLELVSVVGIHSCTMGVPILLEELAAAGQPPTPPASDGAGPDVPAL
jgi:alkylhydroperoxidase/carboxymuconolactone decarboxylase family protein YurZ